MKQAKEAVKYAAKSKSYYTADCNRIEFRTLRWALGGNFIEEGDTKI